MNQHLMCAPRSRPQSGFTLLEVLIALLVMSIGLLGIGKMMMLSARANDSAYMRSQATALGYTILDAMRANRQAAIVQGYDTALGVFPGPAGCGTTVAAACNSGASFDFTPTSSILSIRPWMLFMLSRTSLAAAVSGICTSPPKSKYCTTCFRSPRLPWKYRS